MSTADIAAVVPLGGDPTSAYASLVAPAASTSTATSSCSHGGAPVAERMTVSFAPASTLASQNPGVALTPYGSTMSRTPPTSTTASAMVVTWGGLFASCTSIVVDRYAAVMPGSFTEARRTTAAAAATVAAAADGRPTVTSARVGVPASANPLPPLAASTVSHAGPDKTVTLSDADPAAQTSNTSLGRTYSYAASSMAAGATSGARPNTAVDTARGLASGVAQSAPP